MIRTMTMLPRREFLRLAGLAAAGSALPRPALAQAYPARPVKLVVGFSAGGTTDLLARVLAPPLSERLGQQVIIENKPGGGTNIAIQSVVNAAPDGYTLAMTFATNTINPSLYKSLPFDFQRDMAPVSGLADLPLVLVVNKDVPAKNVTEFVAYAKAKPDKVAFASFGARTISQLAIELLKTSAGFEYVHVPYPGGPQIITDLISGRVQAGMDALPNSLPHIRSGAVRALAVMSSERNPAIPNVPAISEIIPGLAINAGTGIGVPAKTPPEIVERLNRDINACLADPTLKARYADVGAVPIIMTPAEARAGIASDTEKWRKVIEQAGLKPE
jgi:tripartite-type tricarboxylate transporter receptor subunit TctC